MKKLAIMALLFGSLCAFSPVVLAAANPVTGTTGTPVLTPPLGNSSTGEPTNLKTVFLNLLNIAQTILIMLATLYLIYAGFMFVIAKGDPAKIKKAKDALLWGLIGTALILCAEVLAYGIGDTVKEVFKGQ